MLQTQIVSSNVAVEFVQSLGIEITIFAISIALAIAFRGTSFGKQTAASQKVLGTKAKLPPQQREATHKSLQLDETTELRPKVQSTAVSRKVDSMVTFANRRQPTEAIALYAELKASGDQTAIKDVQCRGKKSPTDVYCLLVQCAGALDRPDLIEMLFNDMHTSGIPRSYGFYEAAMKILASKKCYKQALCMYTHLEADGHTPSSVTLSCLVVFAVEVGDLDRAISLFQQLDASSMPSIRAYMTILRVHSKRADWQSSLALIRSMQTRGAVIDSLVLNIALSTGVAAGHIAQARELLNEFAAVGLVDVVSYNTVMKGLAQQKDHAKALALLDQMNGTTVRPNPITFNTAIDAAVRAGQLPDAWGVLTRMRDTGLTPDKFTCTTLMKGLQNGASAEHLSSILDLLKNVTGECPSSTWSYLFRNVIEAAAKNENPALTKKAIAQMRAQQVMMTPQEHQRLLKALLGDA